jgi:DNA-binding transcriptional MerR regulator
MNKDGVTINELSKMANVTVRTIRFYTDEGVLDEPAGRDRYARYTRRHYLQLNAARTLKERYLPLRVIRDQMASLSEAELERLAGPVPPHIEARFNDVENSEDATNAHIIAAQQLTSVANVAHHTLSLPALDSEYTATTLNQTGIDFLSAGTIREAKSKPTYTVPREIRTMRTALSHAPVAPMSTTPTIGDVWHRIVISPSMELHVREDGMQEAGEIRRILASLRKR